MFGKRSRIAPARAISLPTTRGLQARRVSPIVSAAVRVDGWRTQVAWLCVSLASIIALYFVSKIAVKATLPDEPPATAPAKSSTSMFVLSDKIFNHLRLDDELLWPPGRPHPANVPETYGPEALGALAFPFAALVVAMLMSLARKQRRLLREGLVVDADVREVDSLTTVANARTVEVELVVPPLPGSAIDLQRNLVAIRPPDAVGTTEPVLYDPRHPERVLAVADLPGRPRIVDHTIKPTAFPLLHFVLPAAAFGLIVTLAVSVPLALHAR